MPSGNFLIIRVFIQAFNPNVNKHETTTHEFLNNYKGSISGKLIVFVCFLIEVIIPLSILWLFFDW